MASKSQSANQQMVQLITQQTIDLLATLKNDVSQLKSLTEQDRKSCEVICEQASTEYNRLKIQYLRETLILIDKALSTSDEKDLREISEAWALQLDYVTSQCERIASPLIKVMDILLKSDEQIGKKHWYLLGTTIVLFLLIGTAFGFFVAYYYPHFLIGSGIFLVGAGTLTGTAIAVNYKMICTPKCNVRTHESSQLMITKSTENDSNDQTNDASTTDLTTSMKRSIATFTITKEIWQNRRTLQSVKKVAEAELRNLENST